MRVGEPSPAARCRGLFPAKVLLLTSAPSYGERCKAVSMGCLGAAWGLPSPHPPSPQDHRRPSISARVL